MNDTVRKFGGKMTDLVRSEHPVAARRTLAFVFRAYGDAVRFSSGGDLLLARRYVMGFCNRKMADSIARPGRAAVVSLFTPCEIFEALGIPVMVPEGLSCYMTASGCDRVFLEKAEECGVPETLCSYHKMLIGMAETGVLPKPRMIVNTTMVCDANQLSFRYLAEYFDVPHLVLDVPDACSAGNIRYLSDQLRGMKDFVEKHSGRALDKGKFRKTMLRASETLENYRRCLSLKSVRYESIRMTYHMMDALALHPFLGTEEGLKYTEMLKKQLARLPLLQPGEKRRSRILWVHMMPYWQDSISDMFRYHADAEVVCCDVTFDNYSVLDPEQPYESLARQMLQNSLNGPSERRIRRVLKLARQMDIDGIVYFCHWGCKQTLGASAMAKEAFEQAGFPTLVLDGDGCDTRNVQDGQMMTRMGAFLEQLEALR